MSGNPLNRAAHRAEQVAREVRRQPELRKGSAAAAPAWLEEVADLVEFMSDDELERLCGLISSAIGDEPVGLGVFAPGRRVSVESDDPDAEVEAICAAARERRSRGETVEALDRIRTEAVRRDPEREAEFHKPRVTPRDDGCFDVRVGRVDLVMAFDPTAKRTEPLTAEVAGFRKPSSRPLAGENFPPAPSAAADVELEPVEVEQGDERSSTDDRLEE